MRCDTIFCSSTRQRGYARNIHRFAYLGREVENIGRKVNYSKYNTQQCPLQLSKVFRPLRLLCCPFEVTDGRRQFILYKVAFVCIELEESAYIHGREGCKSFDGPMKALFSGKLLDKPAAVDALHIPFSTVTLDLCEPFSDSRIGDFLTSRGGGSLSCVAATFRRRRFIAVSAPSMWWRLRCHIYDVRLRDGRGCGCGCRGIIRGPCTLTPNMMEVLEYGPVRGGSKVYAASFAKL